MVTRITNETTTMQKHGPAAAVAALLCGLFGLPSAFGQDSDNVTVDVGECVEIESAVERLACFAAEVDAALAERGAAESDDPVAVTQDRDIDEDQSAGDETLTRREQRAARAAEERAKRRAERAAEQAAARALESERIDDEYTGTVTALRERLPNRYVITLDNGQVWEQVAPKQYPLRPGLEVRIYPTNWGPSYRMTNATAGGFILVRRVR